MDRISATITRISWNDVTIKPYIFNENKNVL